MVAPVAGVAGVQGLTPITAQIPDFALRQMQAARGQQMAAAMMQQGMAPIDYDPRGRISWTQGLAKLLQSGVGMGMGSQSMQQQAALQQQGMQAMGQAYGMGGPQGATTPQGTPQGATAAPNPQALAGALSPSIAAQQALAQGAQQGSVGPMNTNAATMTALQTPPPQSPVQSPPAPQAPQPGMGGSPAPLNPMGLPPMLLWQASQGDPAAQEQVKTLLANLQTTPEIKNNNWMGMQPGQALANAQGTATKAAQIEYKPGEFTSNAVTGQNSFYPSLPANSQPTSVGPNGQVGSVVPVPGAAQVTANNAYSDAVGHSLGTVGEATNPDGSITKGFNKDLFNSPLSLWTPGQGNPPPQVVPNASPSGSSQPGNSVSVTTQMANDRATLPLLQQELEKQQSTGNQATAAAVQREIDATNARLSAGTPFATNSGSRTVTGPSLTTKTLMDQGGGLLKDAQAAQQGNQSTYAGLDEMDALIKSGAKFGPGTAGLAHFKAIANNYVPGIDLSGAQTNQDVMHKLASTLAGSQSPRSDADLANWQARYPSGELTNQASSELIPILRRNAQVVDARANVMTRASAGGLDKLPDLANTFNQIASPSLVSDGLTISKANAAGPQAYSAALSQYKTSHSDWQQRLGNIQKLGMMGAFQ